MAGLPALRLLGIVGAFPADLGAARQQAGKRLSQLCPLDAAVLVDEQLGEEALVDLSPQVRRCILVLLVAVGGGCQRLAQGDLELVCGCGGGACLALGLSYLPGESVHLFLKQVKRERVCVVGLEHGLALGSQPGQPPGGALLVVVGLLLLNGQLRQHGVSDTAGQSGVEAEAAVVLLDAFFDGTDAHGAPCAGVLGASAAEAEEIVVGAAMAGVAAEDQASAAAATPDAPLKVMGLFPIGSAGEGVKIREGGVVSLR